MISIPPGGMHFNNNNDPTTASYVFPPMGLMVLADRILPLVESIDVIDFNFHDFTAANSKAAYNSIIHDILREKIESQQPDIVMVSVMFSSSYNFFVSVAKEIRAQLPGATILCGGVHASNTAGQILSALPEIDYVMCGEGEEPLPLLLQKIRTGGTEDIVGVHWKGHVKKVDGIFEIAPMVESIDVDIRKYSQVFDMERYVGNTSLFSLTSTDIHMRAFPVMASRGCPMKCVFCASHTVHGYRPRWRSIENIRDEITVLYHHYGVRKIYLEDDNFIPKDKALELFRMLAALPMKDLDVVIQNMSVNHTDHEMIDAIADAGISYIPFAVETGSPEWQKRIRKFCDLEKAIDLFEYGKKKGLNVRAFYIVGFPGETMEEMQVTIDYAMRAKADWSTFSVAVPLPGSEMYNDFVALGYIQDSPEYWEGETIRDRVFDTPQASAKEIKDLAYRANLQVNFIRNPMLAENRLDDAEIVFKNFVQSFDFHIFAYDVLRRIYKAQHKQALEDEMWDTMLHLVKTNGKSREMLKFADLFPEKVRLPLLKAAKG